MESCSFSCISPREVQRQAIEYNETMHFQQPCDWESSPSDMDGSYPGWIPVFHPNVGQYYNSLSYPLIHISPWALLPTLCHSYNSSSVNTDTMFQYIWWSRTCTYQGLCHVQPRAVHTLLICWVADCFPLQDLPCKLKSDCSGSEDLLFQTMDSSHVCGPMLYTDKPLITAH